MSHPEHVGDAKKDTNANIQIQNLAKYVRVHIRNRKHVVGVCMAIHVMVAGNATNAESDTKNHSRGMNYC